MTLLNLGIARQSHLLRKRKGIIIIRNWPKATALGFFLERVKKLC